MPSLEQLYTDDDTNDDDENTNDDDNDTQWTNYDCIGPLACMPNEPKTLNYFYKLKKWTLLNQHWLRKFN